MSQAMKLFRRAAGALSATALLGLTAGVAAADPTSGVDSNLVRPSLDSNGLFTLESGTLLPAHDLSFKLGVGYGQKPLNVAVPGIGTADGADSVLQYDLVTNLTTSLALTKKLQVGLDAGIYRTNTDEGYGERGLYASNGLAKQPTGLLSLRPISNIDPSGNQTPEERAGPTDARLALKYQLTRSLKWRTALQVTVVAPFGDQDVFLGEDNLVYEPRLAADYALNATATSKLVFNVGARIRKRTVLEAYDTGSQTQTMDDAQVVLDVGSEAFAGAGISYELLPQLLVVAEGTYLEPLPEAMSYGSCHLNNGKRCSDLQSSNYFNGGSYGDRAAFALGGIQYRATADVSLVVSGGAGLLGARKEAFHLAGGIVWQPTPAGTRVIGRGDSDGDGIPDSADICPDEPEDKDGYQDDDGCPDLDNDGDGIIDASDSCPDAPEDKDGYQDDDGCPERDNDSDGIPDVSDRCPNEPEDKDNFEDDDGCPDEDNDGDGFPDAKDKCPNEKETVNGYQDQDGCPDQMDTGPKLDATRIDLQGSKISFASSKSSKLTSTSKQLLDQVADLIKANKGLIIRIESHVSLGTSSTNKRVIARQQRRDKALTVRRAKEVYDYLVGKGVNKNQLRQDSLGSSRPLQQPASDPINDRIEFIRQ